MGNSQALHPTYVNIYNKLILIQAPQTRVQMIETCLSGPEYVSAAKLAGVYGQLLAYVSHVRNGLQPPVLPGEPSRQGAAYRNGLPQQIMQPPQITSHHDSLRSQYNPYTPGAGAGAGQQITSYEEKQVPAWQQIMDCLLYTSPSPRDGLLSRMPSSA